MERKGIRGWFSSPAGATVTSTPTGAQVNRDITAGYLGVGGVPMVDARALSTAPLLAAYVDDYTVNIRGFEKQLNRPIDIAVAFTDHNNPDITSNDWPFYLQWPGDRKLILSHALIGYGWNMNDSASGAHDSDYEDAVDNLVPWKHRILAIRPGWEFNVTAGYPWTVGGTGGSNQSAANYAASFRNFAKYIREKLPGVLIDWCPLADHAVPDPWYPGDAYVDVIGNDVYVKQAFHSNDFGQALTWNAGLFWQEAFASSHGKLMGFPEWAIDYTDGSAWITAMAEWMKRPRACRTIYQSYWNSNAVVNTRLSDKPLNLAAYKRAFGEPTTP